MKPLEKGVLSVFLSGIVLFTVSCASIKIPGEDIEKAHNEAINSYNEALSLEQKSYYEEAIALYEKAMSYDKIYEMSLYKKARCEALAELWDSAERDFSTLLARDSSNIAVRQSLAYIHANNGKLETALEEYRLLHEQNSYDDSIAEGYIKTLFMSGDVENAKKELDSYKNQFPKNKEAVKKLESIFTASDE